MAESLLRNIRSQRSIGVTCSLVLIVILLLSKAHAWAIPFSIMYEPLERPQAQFKCFSDYQKRLKNSSRMRIAVALGYSDGIDERSDIVTDHFMRQQITNLLTSPCKYEKQGFCEFRLAEDGPRSPSVYSRELKGPNDESLLVEVHVINSSYDILNSDNKTIYKIQQQAQSDAAKAFYGWALKNADAVFYEGHSRDGGGPDFAPPRAARNGKVDYPWYRKNRPGFTYLLNNLPAPQEAPLFLGLYSCASDSHFRKKLSPLLQQSHLVLSTKVVPSDSTKESLLSSLEAVLNFECPTQIEARIRPYSFIVRTTP